ncbi:hypothetical protein Patl1_16708 [Pistacia atlantica]|uniref:Uncharacterized protein n=1 Tax=Pistacia atlantica TaxID=434234 RepID=A0ACC1B6R0_9ROSI|nr:hypothetical protein Patl1_16708 [Pistacia atlantica]
MLSSSRYTCFEEEEEKNLNQLQPNSICNSTISSSNEEELNLPLGYHFSLVMHYLVNKIFSQQLPANNIRDIDFYAYNPHQLPISEFKYGKPNEAYFFTNLEIDLKGQTRQTTKNGY